jgi:hypothetical protein
MVFLAPLASLPEPLYSAIQREGESDILICGIHIINDAAAPWPSTADTLELCDLHLHTHDTHCCQPTLMMCSGHPSAPGKPILIPCSNSFFLVIIDITSQLPSHIARYMNVPCPELLTGSSGALSMTCH